MIEMLNAPDNVAAMRVTGTLTGPDYDQVIGLVETKLAEHDKIGVVLDLLHFKDVTPEAAWKDIKYDLSKLSQLKRFPRVAVVTEKEWMRTMLRLSDPLIPFVEMKSFGSDEGAAAIAWTAEAGR